MIGRDVDVEARGFEDFGGRPSRRGESGLLKVSAQSSTELPRSTWGRPPSAVPRSEAPRRSHHCLNVCGANGGMRRWQRFRPPAWQGRADRGAALRYSRSPAHARRLEPTGQNSKAPPHSADGDCFRNNATEIPPCRSRHRLRQGNRFCSLAGEAQVERFFHRLILPPVFDDVSLRHLPEQVGAAAGGVLFVASDAKARTHDSTFIAPTLAHSDAAQGSGGQTAVVVGKLKCVAGCQGS